MIVLASAPAASAKIGIETVTASAKSVVICMDLPCYSGVFQSS